MFGGSHPRKIAQASLLELRTQAPLENVKFIARHNKNEGQYAPKDENYEAWKKEYIVPWGTLLDILIVLLFIFFALTFQTTKMTFVLNFDSIFDKYFNDGNNGPSYLYFKQDFIDKVNSSSEKFFTFETQFPSQYPFTRITNMSIDVLYADKTEYNTLISPENISKVVDVATNIISKPFNTMRMHAIYMIQHRNEELESEVRLKVHFTIVFKDVNNLGIIEFRTRFQRAETERIGPVAIDDNLSLDVFPAAIILFDAIAMCFTIYRLISFFQHAKQYARKNYISLYRAVVWKVDLWEMFNLFYQALTIAAVSVYYTVVDKAFGDNIWLLVFVGLAGFMHCIGLFRSMRMKKELWLVAQLITRALGRSLQFVLGFLPFYFGVVFMGVSFFGYFCYLFIGFLRTMKILFSMWHTDVVMDTEDLLLSMAVAPPWLVYTFVILWMVLTGGMVINILISMVEVTLDELLEEHEDE